MKRLTWCVLLILAAAAPELPAQGLRALSSPAAAQPSPAKKDPVKAALAPNPTNPTEPITTEIFADEAFFDSQNSLGIFSGRVIVKDPRFSVQADKLTIHLTKGEKRGLEKAIAEGNVGVVREQPGEDGKPPSRAVGRADMAIYTLADGQVELRGSPRVQSGFNTHVATSPDTVMVISQSGQLTTRGPSRTEIRQEPKPPEGPKP